MDGQSFMDTTDLWYLPHNIYGGSTVKLDRRSGGGMLVRNESVDDPVWEKLIPFGWYDVGSSLTQALCYSSSWSSAVNRLLTKKYSLSTKPRNRRLRSITLLDVPLKIRMT